MAIVWGRLYRFFWTSLIQSIQDLSIGIQKIFESTLNKCTLCQEYDFQQTSTLECGVQFLQPRKLARWQVCWVRLAKTQLTLQKWQETHRVYEGSFFANGLTYCIVGIHSLPACGVSSNGLFQIHILYMCHYNLRFLNPLFDMKKTTFTQASLFIFGPSSYVTALKCWPFVPGTRL